MVSVNTNAAALTALRNLQATSQNLEMVQNRISTGLRIGEAKDNAAYWAISTTLKSDNKSLSTVKDALGLGSATVDVAYQGLTKAKDVLDEIKAKLTAATQSGVDRNVIQAEIKELQNQLKSIANSSVFSGENWLSVNSETSDYSSIKKIVASFARASDNSVSIGTVNIDISNVALFDSSTVLGRDGLLDGRMSLKDATGRDLTIGGAITATGNGVTGGLPTANTSVAGTVSGTAPTQTTNTTPFVAGAVTGSGLAASDKISFDLVIDGKALTVQVAADNGTGAVSINTIHDALAANAMFASVATTTVNGSNLEILTRNSSGSTLLKSVTFTDSAGKVKIPTTTGFTNVAQPATISVAAGSFQAFALDKDDSIVFDIALNDATGTKTVKIDQALVNRALSTPSTPVTNGTVSSMANYQKVIAAAMTAANVANANVTVDSSGNLVIATNDVAGTKAAIAISNVVASGGGRQVSVVEIDISDANMLATGADTGDKIKQVLSAYISLVNAAIGKVTTAASNLGSVASRIDMQKSFVNTLMDTIEKGVSNLVDADMSEESTKLQALQVKQQLGSQALSIANQSANNVLQLFRTLQ